MSAPVENQLRGYIIAGPNGAGKTTFAENFLPFEANCLNFLNADLIAKGISPFNPEGGGCYYKEIPTGLG